MRLRVIVPIIGQHWAERSQEAYAALARPDTEVSAVALERGPASIETSYDEALAVPGVLRAAREAEAQGMDAVLLDCMGDPGLAAARELVSIPVVGPAQASMHLAATLAHKFSLITILEQTVPLVGDQILRYGLKDRAASVRAVNIPVLELEEDEARVVNALIDESVRAVTEDGAHIIIPGCTGMIGLARRVEEGLTERGCAVPVIEPPWAAVKLAESLVEMGLAHSKRAYPPPPPKEIVGYS